MCLGMMRLLSAVGCRQKLGSPSPYPQNSNGKELPAAQKGVSILGGEAYKLGYANCDEKYGQGVFNKLFARERYYLEQTCAVGLYPQGQAASGVMDLAGNVLEWCLNKYHQPMELEPDASGDQRVVRGGSWLNTSEDLRCAVRFRDHPADRSSYLGFRVCAFSLAAGF